MTKPFFKILLATLSVLCLSFSVNAQNEKTKNIHKTIIDFDFSFKLRQSAKNEFDKDVDIKNDYDHFFGVRYTNVFFIKDDLSLGFGIGLETASVLEIPCVIDIRKYFGTTQNKSFLSLNVGKTYNGYSEFKTWLGEVGVGKNIKLGKKTSLNIGLNYQLTYLKSGTINNDDRRDWVKDFYTNTLAIKTGIMF